MAVLFNFTKIFFAFSFLVILAMTIDPDVLKVDKGIYGNNVISVIQDYDLNTFNQALEKDRWIATKTYNHPDFHDHGVVNLWAPFFVYKNILDFLNISSDIHYSKAYDIVQIIVNIFFGIIALILSLKLFNLFFIEKKSLKKTFFTGLLATPFFWYFAIHPFNSDITSLVLSNTVILFYIYLLKEQSKSNWFLFGLVFSISFIGKISIIFYGVLFPHYLFISWKKKEITKNYIFILYFIIGFIIPFTLFLLNEKIKYGFWHYGYATLINYDSYYIKDLLFGPSGYFYISPVYFLSLIGLLILIFKIFKKDTSKNIKMPFLLLFLAMGPIAKTLIESFTFFPNNELGARHYIIDTSIILFLLYIFSLYTKKYIQYFLYSISVIWMSVVSLWFFYHLGKTPFTWGDLYIENFDFISLSFSILKNRILFMINNINLGLYAVLIYTPLILISISMIIFLKKMLKDERKTFYFLKAFSIYLFLSYSLISGLNFINNEKNAEAMKKKGVYKKTLIASGTALYMYAENMGAILDTDMIAKKRNDQNLLIKNNIIKEKYLKKIFDEIEYDPIQFRENFKNGNVYIPFN